MHVFADWMDVVAVFVCYLGQLHRLLLCRCFGWLGGCPGRLYTCCRTTYQLETFLGDFRIWRPTNWRLLTGDFELETYYLETHQLETFQLETHQLETHQLETHQLETHLLLYNRGE